MPDPAKQTAAAARERRRAGRRNVHCLRMSPYYADIVKNWMDARGITRLEAYHQLIEIAIDRSTFRVQTQRELTRRIADRAGALARQLGGDAAHQLAEIIRIAKRVGDLA